MKVSILMSLSVNGYIARENGEEDFLANDNWQMMKDYIKEYDNLVWGRTTYESVMNWGEEYVKDLENVNLFIVSNKDQISKEKVVYCKSLKQVIKEIKKRGIKDILISGGAKLNSAFIQEKLATDLILSYNPVIIPNGINLFTSTIPDIKLELYDVENVGNSIIHAKYHIIYL